MNPIYATVDPSTGERLESFPTATSRQVGDALDRGAAAFATWRATPPPRRAGALQRLADLLEARADSLAGLMAQEMGKPVAQGRAEAAKCAWVCRYYADHGEEFLARQRRESDGSEAWAYHEPLGPVLAIMPWNFPLWQFYRFAAPALMAGNVTLLKHAPNTPGCGIRIEKLAAEAGLPLGAVQNLMLTNEQAADVMQDPRVRGVTLTGSTRAGREVAACAGRQLKKMVMELGGSDPFIVFDDADLQRAVEVGVQSRCLNNGQSCIAAKRFLVHEKVFPRFREEFVAAMEQQTPGDPRHDDTRLGPLARRDLRDQLADQVQRSVDGGAQALCGGSVPEGPGWFYPATVLVDIEPGTPAADEELFGPVATLVPFRTEGEAIRLANATEFGLGASVWTTDAARGQRLIPQLEAGAVFVNGMVKSDPRLPFGGVKQSGFGRELGREGMLEFVNLKTVWVA